MIVADTTDESRVLEELIIANGVNGTTGEYWTPPIRGQQLVDLLGKKEQDPPDIDKLAEKHNRTSQPAYAPVFGVDPKNLAETGWGVIYGPSVSEAVKEALSPLLELRKAQAGDLFREYIYHGLSGQDFLIEHEVSIAGAAEPQEMPYYLLLVGSPTEIPFQFQFEIDVDRALGRIFFDTVEEYANYAQSVVAAEKGEVRLPRQATFFSVENQNDPATQMSTTLMMEPLLQKFTGALQEKQWQVNSYLRQAATRPQLEAFLGGDSSLTPAFLMTASHGMAFERDDPRMIAHQGALLCSEWERGAGGPISESAYFAGDHLSSEARLHGLIGFFFACYGAGTPKQDEFMQKVEGRPKQIAPHDFVARLPRRMLSHPRGGALAVIGHVERAWTYSFKWNSSDRSHLGTFDSTLGKLFEGYPIGDAMDYVNLRHASASVMLASLLQQMRHKINVSPYQLLTNWTVNNDARDYIILGDPAVRLCVPETEEEAVQLSTIQLKDVDLTPYKPGTVVAAQPVAGAAEAAAAITEAAPSMSTVEQEAEPMAILSDDQKEQIRAALKTITQRVTKALHDVSTMEVLTYLSDDVLENVYDKDKKEIRDQAKLKAVTIIELNGDVKNMIPARTVEALSEAEKKLTVTVEVDEELLKIHRDMVELAQVNRTTFLKNLAEIAVTLVNTRL